MSQHPPRRLEAGFESECGYCRVTGWSRELTKRAAEFDNHMQFLFLEPNASDPLNKDAAEDLKTNREGFKRNVRSAMGGGSVRGESFERVLK